MLKRKKIKIETEILTDNKNKETIVNQMRLLSEKLDEIENRQQAKRTALAKIDDTLTQSEIGKNFPLTVHLKLISNNLRLLKNHRLPPSAPQLRRF